MTISAIGELRMGIFDVFKAPVVADARLGELRRTRGLWRGAILLGEATVPLALSGRRAAPDPHALEMARAVGRRFAGWREDIERALFEHYSPYAEAVAAGDAEPPQEGLPFIQSSVGVWPHTRVVFVQVTPLDRELTVEIGLRVAWDEEHTLGARFQAGRFLGLCGSVLAP